MSDRITRKDIITDDAIKWGSEYVKEVEKAIGKNAEFINSIKLLNDLAKDGRLTRNVNDFTEAQRKSDAQMSETDRILREQIKLENQLADTKAKLKAANSDTAKQLAEEKLLLQQANAEIRKEALARLGLTGAYKKLSDARLLAKNRLRDLIASENASNNEIKKAQKEFDTLDQRVRKADRAVGDFSKNVGNYKTAFGGLRDIFSAFGLIGGITGFVYLGKSIFNTAKELQSLDLALKSVTETQENYKEQQMFLNTIAQKYGLEIKNLTKQYTSFYIAAKNKMAASEIQELFENISKSGSALGLSNETLERSFAAVNQMLSKGTVASEELRGQLAEALPGSVQAMVRAVQKLHPEIKNLNEEGLFEMIKNGKILASEVLPETARQLVKLVGADKAEGMETLSKTTNRLSNSWTKLVMSINNADTSGFSVFVKKIIDGLSNIADFTGLLFKNEAQTVAYFEEIGATKGLERYNAILKNISNTTKENQEATKKEILYRERETIKANQKIIKLEKEKRESILGGDRSLFHQFTKEEEAALVKIGEAALIIKKLKEADSVPIKTQSNKTEGTRIQAPIKKKIDNSTFELEKQRLELAISTNDQIAKNQKLTDEERVKATEDRARKELELIELVKNREFAKNKEIYNNAVDYAKKKKESDLSNPNITADGKAKAENDFSNAIKDAEAELLNANEKTKIDEKYSYDKIQIEKKTADEIEKILEFSSKEIDKTYNTNLAVLEKAKAEELKIFESAFNDEFDKIKGNIDKEKDLKEKHEKELFEIEKKYASQSIQLEIDKTKLLLDEYKKQTDDKSEDALYIAELQKKIAELELLLIKNNAKVSKDASKDKKTAAQEWVEKNKEEIEASKEILNGLSELTNAFSERKIQNLEKEIDKNNEYFDKQLELYDGDEQAKKTIEKERALRNEEVKKKIVKEKEKQAKFDKAIAINQIGIQTALSIVKASPNPVLITLAAVAGAMALAAAIAAPIPKFRKGTMNAPEGLAVVGDGGVSEVVTNAQGLNPVLTPATDTFMNLNKGDKVFPNIRAYNDYLRSQQIRQMGSFGAVKSDDRMLTELQKNTKAIERLKLSVNVKNNKIDLSHQFWAKQNRNWS